MPVGRKRGSAFDALASVYPLCTAIFHAKPHAVVRDAVAPDSGQRILELACGSGQLLARLTTANAAGTTVGLDVSPRMATLSRRGASGLPLQSHVADARFLPYAAGTFDVVVACYLLVLLSAEHRERVLGEVARVLKPAGRLVLAEAVDDRVVFSRTYRLLAWLWRGWWGRLDPLREEDARRWGLVVREVRDVGSWLYPSRVVTLARGEAPRTDAGIRGASVPQHASHTWTMADRA